MSNPSNKFSPSVNTLLNPCIPQPYLPPVAECVSVSSDDSKFIISRELKEKVVKTGDSEDDFVVDLKVVETSKVDRQEYIDSFKDDVGILNIIKKVELTGDVSLLNERIRSSVPVDEDGKESVVDISNIDDSEKVRSSLLGVSSLLKGMPEDLKNAILNLQGEELSEFLKNYGSQPVDKKEGE